MVRPAKFGRNRSCRAGDIEWPYILMHRAYPLALEKKHLKPCRVGWGLVLGEWYLPILWTTLVPSRAYL